MKKLFLKISQYSNESCRPATLLKTDSNAGVFFLNIAKFLRTPILKSIYLIFRQKIESFEILFTFTII